MKLRPPDGETRTVATRLCRADGVRTPTRSVRRTHAAGEFRPEPTYPKRDRADISQPTGPEAFVAPASGASPETASDDASVAAWGRRIGIARLLPPTWTTTTRWAAW